MTHFTLFLIITRFALFLEITLFTSFLTVALFHFSGKSTILCAQIFRQFYDRIACDKSMSAWSANSITVRYSVVLSQQESRIVSNSMCFNNFFQCSALPLDLSVILKNSKNIKANLILTTTRDGGSQIHLSDSIQSTVYELLPSTNTFFIAWTQYSSNISSIAYKLFSSTYPFLIEWKPNAKVKGLLTRGYVLA